MSTALPAVRWESWFYWSGGKGDGFMMGQRWRSLILTTRLMPASQQVDAKKESIAASVRLIGGQHRWNQDQPGTLRFHRIQEGESKVAAHQSASHVASISARVWDSNGPQLDTGLCWEGRDD